MSKENLSINELIDLVDSTNRAMDSSLMRLVSERLYYARSYEDKDKTGEGRIRREELIDRIENIVSIIKKGEFR